MLLFSESVPILPDESIVSARFDNIDLGSSWMVSQTNGS